MPDLVDCTHVFSNGTEYCLFIEEFCDHCTRFRNGQCRIYRAIEMAMLDEKHFPFADLQEYERYAGKVCRKFTAEKPVRKRSRKELPGQVGMEVMNDD